MKQTGRPGAFAGPSLKNQARYLVLRIRVRSITCAIFSFEVMVVFVLFIDRRLRLKMTRIYPSFSNFNGIFQTLNTKRVKSKNIVLFARNLKF